MMMTFYPFNITTQYNLSRRYFMVNIVSVVTRFVNLIKRALKVIQPHALSSSFIKYVL